MRTRIRTEWNRAARLAQITTGDLVAAAMLAGSAAAAPADYTFVMIASDNDPGFVASGFLDFALNDLGQVAYAREGDVNSPTFAHGGAVIISDGVSSATIVDGATPVPAGNFFQTFLNLGDPGSANFTNVDLNDSGQVVFEAELHDRVDPPRIGDTGQGIFATDIDGNLVEIGVGDSDCCGPEPEFVAVGGAAINDRGVVSFATREQSPGAPGFEPAVILTRSTSDPAGSSAIALRDFNDSYYDPDAARQVGTQVRLDLFSDLDDAGSVVASGFFSFVPPVGDFTMGGAILAGPAVPPVAVTVGDGVVNPFSVSSAAEPEINNAGLIAFLANPNALDKSLFGVDLLGGPPELLVAAVTPIDQVFAHDTNDAGDVAVSLGFDGFTRTGVFTGPDLELDRVLGTGDTVFGRPVGNVLRGQINDLGQVGMLVIFADDGSQAILRADPLGSSGNDPCPASLPRQISTPCLPGFAAELQAASPVTIGRAVTLDGNETALAFVLRFRTPTGDLTVTLDGANPTTISATDQSVDEFVQRVVHLPLPVSGMHELAFTLDGPAGSIAQIGDIAFLIGAARDPIAGGTFTDGTGQPFTSVTDAGWTVTGPGTATLHAVPEPDAPLLVMAASATLLGMFRRHRRFGASKASMSKEAGDF